MHRLNSTEYDATVQDVLGAALQPASAAGRGGELNGFDDIASVLGIDENQYDRYFKAAQALAVEAQARRRVWLGGRLGLPRRRGVTSRCEPWPLGWSLV